MSLPLWGYQKARLFKLFVKKSERQLSREGIKNTKSIRRLTRLGIMPYFYNCMSITGSSCDAW